MASLSDIFRDIYDRGLWGSDPHLPYVSGNGSLPTNASAYESWIVGIISRDEGIQIWVDIGCGDFQVASRILAQLPRKVEYVGCDIVPKLIDFNGEAFGGRDTTFKCLDITIDPPPNGDLVTVRQVFQHLSNAEIASSLTNLRARFREAIIAEEVAYPSTPNRDIVAGSWTRRIIQSSVLVDKPPFCLRVLHEQTFPLTSDSVLRVTRVAL